MSVLERVDHLVVAAPDLEEGVARALKAVFELCVARGIITREEYLERLASAPD